MRYTNTKEAAAIAGRPQRTIERWARCKMIKARRVGDRGHYDIAVDGDEVEEWLVQRSADDDKKAA